MAVSAFITFVSNKLQQDINDNDSSCSSNTCADEGKTKGALISNLDNFTSRQVKVKLAILRQTDSSLEFNVVFIFY